MGRTGGEIILGGRYDTFNSAQGFELKSNESWPSTGTNRASNAATV